MKTSIINSGLAVFALTFLSFNSQASENSDLFISSASSGVYALNGLHGKPPYNRAKLRRQQAQRQEVEMSALEIDSNSMAQSGSRYKRTKGGHPERSKSHRKVID